MNKEIEGKEMFNHLKHFVIGDVGFIIVQLKTRRTQKITLLRWLTETQEKDLEILDVGEAILIKNCYNVREALRAAKKEAETERKLKFYYMAASDKQKDKDKEAKEHENTIQDNK